jgi:hypothetical protein
MNISPYRKINCQLFSVNFDDQCNTFKEKDALIINKSIYINQEKYYLEYSFEIPFDAEISIEKKNKTINKVINTKIIYSSLFESYNLYTYLTCLQRIRLSYNFKNIWFQKSSNKMWLFGILVTIIIAIVANLHRKTERFLHGFICHIPQQLL